MVTKKDATGKTKRPVVSPNYDSRNVTNVLRCVQTLERASLYIGKTVNGTRYAWWCACVCLLWCGELLPVCMFYKKNHSSSPTRVRELWKHQVLSIWKNGHPVSTECTDLVYLLNKTNRYWNLVCVSRTRRRFVNRVFLFLQGLFSSL